MNVSQIAIPDQILKIRLPRLESPFRRQILIRDLNLVQYDIIQLLVTLDAEKVLLIRLSS